MSKKQNPLDKDIEPVKRFTVEDVRKVLSRVGLPARIKQMIIKELLK